VHAKNAKAFPETGYFTNWLKFGENAGNESKGLCGAGDLSSKETFNDGKIVSPDQTQTSTPRS